MIGKIKKGSGFKGCVNYVLGKEQAALLHADGVLTESRGDIIRSFCMQTGMNPDLKKPVGHIALSYSAVDAPKLTDEKMIQLALTLVTFISFVDDIKSTGQMTRLLFHFSAMVMMFYQ